MVDFKKLLNNRKHMLPVTGPELATRGEAKNAPARTQTVTYPVLETALHRELSDPLYLDQLLAYVDEASA